jgi:hypothetical protein
MASVDEHTETEWADLEETAQLDEPEPADTIEVAAAGTVLDVIRERRETLAVEHTYLMLVPGYNELLALRCTPLRGRELTQLRLRLERSKDPSRDFALGADIVINVCEAVVARRTTADPWESLDPTGDDVTVGERLAELLRVEATSSRQVVRALFDLAPSPELAVGDAVGDYLSWAQGADADLDKGLLGES